MRGLIKRGVSALLSISIIFAMIGPSISLKVGNTTKEEVSSVIAEAPSFESKPVEIEKTEFVEIDSFEAKPKPEYPKLYTEKDAEALAKMVWGEARGVRDFIFGDHVITGKCQKAAVIWTALNRYDAGYEDTIYDVVTAKHQYSGYKQSNKVDEDILELVHDVLDRWNSEKHGETNVGRVLPSDYYWFVGDGRYNHFRNEYKTSKRYTWELEDVYATEKGADI